MPIAATTREGFDTVSQSGSKNVWTGLSNMPYPTEGEGTVPLTSTVRESNSLYLGVPHEAVNIPTGAMFLSAVLYLTFKKTGTYSSATNLDWTVSTNVSTSTAFSYTLTSDETYVARTYSGDATTWRINTSYSDTAIITALKSGTIKFRVNVSNTAAIAVDAKVKLATVVINYKTVDGRYGALVVTLT